MKGKVAGILGGLVLAAGGATLAWSATSSDSTTIQACVAKNGKVSIYEPGQACLAGEHAISWAVQGPAGPQGPPGPDGTGTNASSRIGGGMNITAASGNAYPGPMILNGMSHEIVSPRDAASGLPTGKRQHKPLTITKEIDKSTPLLMRAIFTNETLPAVELTLDRADGTHIATVKLTNAQVADHLQQGSTETVSFTYQKITWTWIDGGISATDDWNSPNG
jgi:type VI secretion system secreted protein Hcp